MKIPPPASATIERVSQSHPGRASAPWARGVQDSMRRCWATARLVSLACWVMLLSCCQPKTGLRLVYTVEIEEGVLAPEADSIEKRQQLQQAVAVVRSRIGKLDGAEAVVQVREGTVVV